MTIRRLAALLAGMILGLIFGQPRASARAWARPQQPGPEARRERKAQQAERQAARRQAQRQQAQRQDLHQHPPQFFRQLRDLPPGEQDRILANDQRFHQLPPERQQQIRDNLRRWSRLTPEQQQAMRKDEQFFQSLPPEKRAQLRQETSSPEWQQLPARRRQALVGAFRQMRELSPADRQKFLSSPDVQKNFSPHEREILSRLGGLLP